MSLQDNDATTNEKQSASTSAPASATATSGTATSTSTAVILDGSTGEGGGQILRNAISYATILQRELEISQIRAKRSKPGLKAQHTASIQLPVQLCGGTLMGDQVGSSDIVYAPPSANGDGDDDTTTKYLGDRSITKDIGTAGSLCLLLQAALPCTLLHCNGTSRLTLKGGTNAAMAPQYDYWHDVFLPVFHQQCGLEADQIKAQVDCRGYFPRGGGQVQVIVKPLAPLQTLKPIQMTERGELQSIHIRSFHAGKLPRHLAQDMAKAAQRVLKQSGVTPRGGDDDDAFTVQVVTEQQAVGSALGILIVATTTTGCRLAGSALSSPRQKAQDVGQEAALELVKAWQSGGCVDEWLQDQLILYMALADGASEMLTGCLTQHTQTAIWTAEQFCGANLFQVQKLEDSNNKKDGEGESEQKQQQPSPNKQENNSRNSKSSKRPRKGDPSSGTAGETDNYGQEGLIPGKHLIRCNGIGFKRLPLKE